MFQAMGDGTRVAVSQVGRELTSTLTKCEERRCAMVKKISALSQEMVHCVKNEKGVTTMEYALVGTLISIAAIATMGPLGTAVAAAFGTITAAF
jgi:Flp pilus assembly pilin Flp